MCLLFGFRRWTSAQNIEKNEINTEKYSKRIRVYMLEMFRMEHTEQERKEVKNKNA